MREKEQTDHENFINHGVRNHQRTINERQDNVVKHLNYREFKNMVGYVPVDVRDE
jgi:hypothetical protein